MTPVKTIVVATDFSDTADEALTVAVALAEGTDRRIELVHVVLDLLQQPWTIEEAGVDFAGLQAACVDDAQKELKALLERRHLDPSTITTHVVVGRPDAEIVRFARERGAGLIVMGTHGYGGVKRLVLGSVADHVLRQAACPVLVVPASALAGHGDAVQASAAGAVAG